MATYDFYLPVPTRNQSPYVEFIRENIIKPDGINIIPAVFKDIPQVYKLVNLVIRIVATADVADRNVAVFILSRKDIDQTKVFQMQGCTATANQTKITYYSRVNYVSGTGVSFGGGGLIGIGEGIIFQPDNYMNIYTAGGANGDRLDVHAIFKYMNRELGLPDPAQDIEWFPGSVQSEKGSE